MNDWIDAESRAERAHELYEEGLWAEAAAELQAAIDINPENAAWHFNFALTLEAMGRYDKACKAYRAALKLEPDDMETLNCLGVNLTRAGRYAKSLKCFERIERLDATYEPCYCNRIITYTEMGDHEQAELMFYLARQVRDECPLCYYNLGNSLYARGLNDKAVWCWWQSLRLDSAHRGANARIAEACWAQGDLAGARRHYEAELVLADDDVDTLLDLGEMLMQLGEIQEAEEKFRCVLGLAPDNAEAHYCLGELAVKRNEPAVAEAQFRLVLSLDRHYPGAHACLGRVLLRQRLRQEAIRHLLAELEHCGDDVDILQELGEMFIEARLMRRANSVLKRLVNLQPKNPHIQHNLAVSFFMLHKFDDGIRHCRRALKLKPDYPLALYNLALAHMQKGQIPRARRYAARALTIVPTDENVIKLSKRLGLKSFWSRLRVRLTPRSRRRERYDLNMKNL